MRPRTFHSKLLASIIAASAAFLVALGTVAVGKISDLTRDNVQSRALDLVALYGKQIEAFFGERGRVVTTVFASPTVQAWFAGYDRFRRPLDNDPEYREVLGYFRAVPAADPTVIAVFLATDSTSEYFWSEGRVERAGYDPKQRWWWKEAVAKGRLYVASPGVDAGTGEVSVTVQTPVHLPSGRFLGVGGIDVRLGTLAALVGGIKYHGAGRAFLVDNAGQVIYFPDLDGERREPGARLATPLAEVDRVFPATEGFTALSRRLTERTRGLQAVRWRGEELIAVHVPVRMAVPELDWTLGLLVPEELITASIRRARSLTLLVFLVSVASIAGLTLLASGRVAARLREDERRRAAVLAEANARLREADRMKSQFLANMSHELRTPLNSIIGFSAVLRSRLADTLEPRFLRFLDNIHASGQHLLTLISDILDLSKIEAGKLEIHPEPLSVLSAVTGVTAIVRGLASEHGVSLAVEVPEDLPPLEADPVRLKQILLNLLSNAVKFSPEGATVRAVASALTAADSPLGVDSLALAVIDRGIGIAREDQETIFEEFRQLDAAGNLKQAGTGLGLALVRRLVALHRGRVTVESSPGAGSTFTAVLPCRFAGAPLAAPEPGPEAAAGAPPDPVLVVEDDARAFARIAADLEAGGYRSVRSRDGTDAVALAHTLRPLAIVLDIVLPGIDGWAILSELKSQPETASIPVIIVSVLANHQLGLALGADAYFCKPVERERLLACLARLVRRPDQTRARVLVIDDDPHLHELLDELLGTGDYLIEHASSGQEGVRLAQASPPELIILDLMMDGMDGFEVAGVLRADPRTHTVPVVVLTARHTTRGERERLRGKIAVIVEKGEGVAGDLPTVIDDLIARRRR